jgi:hypothetical protein
MAMSDFLEDTVLDMVLNSVAYVEPATVWIALFTAAPSDSGGGTEVTGGSYAREEVPAAGWTITAPSPTRAGNTAAIDFITATASWGTVTHVGVFDAITTGNLLFHGILTSSRVVDNGDTFSFAIDALGVALD